MCIHRRLAGAVAFFLWCLPRGSCASPIDECLDIPAQGQLASKKACSDHCPQIGPFLNEAGTQEPPPILLVQMAIQVVPSDGRRIVETKRGIGPSTAPVLVTNGAANHSEAQQSLPLPTQSPRLEATPNPGLPTPLDEKNRSWSLGMNATASHAGGSSHGATISGIVPMSLTSKLAVPAVFWIALVAWCVHCQSDAALEWARKRHLESKSGRLVSAARTPQEAAVEQQKLPRPWVDTQVDSACASSQDRNDDTDTMKLRVPYLDHVRLMCMATLFVGQALQMPLHACGDDSPGSSALFPPAVLAPLAATTALPGWHSQLQGLVQSYGIQVFAFCNGAVAYVKVTPSRVRAFFHSLLLPMLFFHAWYYICWAVPAGGMGTVRTDLSSLLVSSEPWLLKCVFAWRLMLYILGDISDGALIIFGLFAHVFAVLVAAPAAQHSLLLYVTHNGIFFAIGHVVFRRRAWLGHYLGFLHRHPLLRVCCLLLFVAQWVDAVCFGGLSQLRKSLGQPILMFTHGLPSLAGLAAALFGDSLTLLQGFVATAWIPTQYLPVLSGAGKHTLYAQLLGMQGCMVCLTVWRAVVPTGALSVWWGTWIGVQPFLAVFFCTEPVRFFLWPLAQPTWFGQCVDKDTFARLSDVAWVKRMGPHQWFLAFALVHVIWVLGLAHFGSLTCHHDVWA